MTTSQVATDKPDEFCAGGESPPNTIPPQLAEELAQIIADALHEDMKQYPKLSDIPPVSEPAEGSRRQSDRGRRSRHTTPESAPLHEAAA